MSELSVARRRRADAERSRAAVLDAAIVLLGRRPSASVEEIAVAAGVSRQTVYAHYPSREALVRAVVDRVTDDVTAAIDAVDLGSGTAVAALRRWVGVSWQLLDRYPLLLDASLMASDERDDHDRHQPIIERLTALVERGVRTGEFDRTAPVGWLVAAIIALGHAAGQEVGAGRMSARAAGDAFSRAVVRLCRRDK